MSECKRVAIVDMEEEYIRLQIEYTNGNDRTIICSAIDEVEKALDAHPEVLHKRDKNSGGTYFIEFYKEDHTNSRIAGDFIKELLCKLNISSCDKNIL